MANFTKNAIRETFLQLLDRQPLSQITVRDIVENCGINRNTFYYHFRDIPSLIEELVTEEADRIIREHPTVESMEDAFCAAIDFASANRRAVLHIYNSVSRSLFEQYLWKVCTHVVTVYGETVFPNEPAVAEDREIISQYYICQCFGMAISWLDRGMKDDIRSRIRRICELQRGMLEETVRRCADGRPRG